MSSPLSSLKKQHKSPFTNAGQRPMPFRNPVYSDDESKLLEEITGGMASQRLKTRDPFTGGLPKLPDLSPRISQGFGTANTHRTSGTGGPSDHELMSTMMSRITQLESKVAYQASELNEKNKKIQVLTEKVKLLQKSQESDTHTQIAALENKCYVLQDQIQDMETFLADYGMIWVGNQSADSSDDDSDDDGDPLWRQASSVSQQPTFRVDYNRLFENLKDLNALAGDGVAAITHTKDGARLKMPDSVQLTVYANGIFMFNGPFRPFTDTHTQAFLKDVLDGYFPSELQGRYPDGVPFNVTDKREKHFEDKRAEIFTGAGQTLGGETKPSRLVPTKLQDNKVSSTQTSEPDRDARETTCEKPGPQLTVEQFLQKLPRSVIKSGKVIDIRSSVGGTIQGGANSQTDLTVVETDTVLEMKKRLEGDDAGRPFTPRDITTLRVKSEDGNHTYILKMKFNDTVGDLRNYLKTQRGEGSVDFDIVSAYPNKMHTNDNMTLHDAGLTPNAVAHLKVRKS